MTKAEAEKELAKRELAKRRFSFYVEYIFKKYVKEDFHTNFFQKLQDVADGKIKKLMVFMPPRSGKSESIGKLLPSWILGNYPDKEVMCTSYAADLANKHSRECRNLTKEKEFKNVFPDFKLADDKAESGNWETKQKGGYYSAGVGGAITGRGFDFGIIDDPVKNREEAESPVYREKVWDWYTSTFLTRKQGDNSAIIVLMTRWHTDDLAGRLLELESNEWEILSLQAIDDNNNALVNNRDGYGIPFYEGMRKSIGIRDFEALYQQDPIKGSGNIFKKEEFKYFALSDIKWDDYTLAIHIDPAWSTRSESDDFAVSVTARHKVTREIYEIDIFGKTLLPSQAYSYIISLAEKWKQFAPLDFISIEKVDLSKKQGEFITGLEKYMHDNGKFYTILYHEPRGMGKKEDRIKFALEPMFNRGAIYFRCDDIDNGDWSKQETQLLKFPVGAHDDLADVLCQAVIMWDKKGSCNKEVTESSNNYLQSIRRKKR